MIPLSYFYDMYHFDDRWLSHMEYGSIHQARRKSRRAKAFRRR